MSATVVNGLRTEPYPGLGRGRTVPLGEADRELRRAWAAIDEDSRRVDGEGMLRLREVNLVAVSGESDLEQSRVTAALAARDHPGRVIVVAPGGSGSMASIATGCMLDGYSKRRVCSEEVVIRGALMEEEQLRAAVLQLLVPDVPVVGWWTGPVSGDARSLPWLAEMSDQFVTDLSLSPDARAAFGTLIALVAEQPDLRLRDMEWLRLLPWRQLTAELFERPDRRVLIPSIERLEIRHRGAPQQALLYAAWFAFRLRMAVEGEGWKQADGSSYIAVRGVAPTAMNVAITADQDQRTPTGSERGLVGVRIHLTAEMGGGEEKEECAGRALAISRQPHSLISRCGTGETFDEAVLKCTGIAEQTDFELLSWIIDTPAHEWGLKDVLRTAFELATAPGSAPVALRDGVGAGLGGSCGGEVP